jgi:glucosamine--fructose-6-phosphate aminotransferase (isomerizing)
MCGIFGAVGIGSVAPALVGGLKRLEYRGYDSAGLAILTKDGLVRKRAVGKVAALERVVRDLRADGTVGISHTRWATHGAASENNAHPHLAGSVAVVHNGIIENYRGLREALSADGAIFESETDTEVVPWLVTMAQRAGMTFEAAVTHAVSQLTGSFALGLISSEAPGQIIAVRRGSPLVIGLGEGCSVLSSDPMALSAHANQAIDLKDGDIAVMTADHVRVTDENGFTVDRPSRVLAALEADVSVGDHPHFMHKEMHEQPSVARRVLDLHADDQDLKAALPFNFARLNRLTLIACGTSYHAALIARHWFETIADLNVDVDIASEYRFRNIPPGGREAAILISQSGETADTLACLDGLHRRNVATLGLVNRQGSALTRRAQGWLDLGAGPEIGVASTKAFTAQLVLLARLAIYAASVRKSPQMNALLPVLGQLPHLLEQTLLIEPVAYMAAGILAASRSAVFIGRSEFAALALEGALKLKEISYVHAEGFAAGELKHGPIALIEPGLPVVCLAFSGDMFEKTASNIEEVKARGGRAIVIGDPVACRALAGNGVVTLTVPEAPALLRPMLATIPLQMLAYHAAVARGADVDRPRNLAKSVTVE